MRSSARMLLLVWGVGVVWGCGGGRNSRPTDVSPTDASPTDVSPTDVSPTDASPTDVSPRRTDDVLSPEALRTEVQLTDLRPEEVWPVEVLPTDVDLEAEMEELVQIDACLPEESECDGQDDDCDGEVDEGVLSPCGNCDPMCRQVVVGAGGDEPFAPGPDNSDGCAVNELGYLIMSGGSNPEEATYRHSVFCPELLPVVWLMAIADLDTQGTTECYVVLRLRAGNDEEALQEAAWETAFWPLTELGPFHGLELFGFPPSSILEFEVKLVAGSSSCLPVLRSLALQYRLP